MSEPLTKEERIPVCDSCGSPAFRMTMSGPPRDRRFYCDAHMYATACDSANDWLRELYRDDVVTLLRKVNVAAGRLSPAKFRKLERESRGW